MHIFLCETSNAVALRLPHLSGQQTQALSAWSTLAAVVVALLLGARGEMRAYHVEKKQREEAKREAAVHISAWAESSQPRVPSRLEARDERLGDSTEVNARVRNSGDGPVRAVRVEIPTAMANSPTGAYDWELSFLPPRTDRTLTFQFGGELVQDGDALAVYFEDMRGIRWYRGLAGELRLYDDLSAPTTGLTPRLKWRLRKLLQRRQ